MCRETSLLVLVLFLVWVRPTFGEDILVGRVFSMQGDVFVSRDDGTTWKKAEAFQDLYEGDVIRTGKLARVSILLVDETMMKIDSNTIVKLEAVVPSGRTKIAQLVRTVVSRVRQSLYKILRGRVWLRTDAELVVETPAVSLGIRGTELSVTVRPDGETLVSMLEGFVELKNPFGALMVRAGEEALAKPGMAPAKRILVSPEDAVQWCLFYPTPVSFRDYFFVSPDPHEIAFLIEATSRALDTAPSDPHLLAKKGQLLHDSGKFEEAEKVSRIMMVLPDARTWALEILGWVELQRGNFQGAIQTFQMLERMTEMSALGLSLAHYATGQWEEAMEVVDKGARFIGRTPRLLAHSAMLKLFFGNVEEAMTELQEASTQGYALSLGLESNIMLTLNKKDLAMEKALEAIRRNPWSSTAHTDLAWVKQAYFDLNGAMEAARRALELDPRNVRAAITYAQLLFGFGNLREAEEIVERAMEINPNESMIHTLRGFLLLARRDADGAVEAFQRAISLNNLQGQPHLGLGIAFMRKGDVERALEEMLVATLLEPRVAINYTYLGKALYQIRDFEGALKMMQRAKSLDPKDPSPYLYTGVMYTDLNMPAEAVRDLQKAVELNDNKAIYRARFLLDEDRATKNINLARAYRDLGLDGVARNVAMLSLKDDPNNSGAHLFMANALVGEKDRTAAAGSEFLKFLLLMPANQNSFNSFNEYTSFFEIPKIGGTLQAQGGNLEAQGYDLSLWGSWGDLAAREILTYWTTDGYKRNNFERSWLNQTTVKWAAGLEHELLLNFMHNWSRKGDQSQDLNAFVSEDLDRTFESPYSTYTVGYHWRISPTSDFLMVLRRDETDGLDEDGPLSEGRIILGPTATLRQLFGRLDFTQKYWHVAAVHLFHFGHHRVNYGLEVMKGETEVKDLLVYRYRSLFDPSLDLPMLSKNRIEPFFLSLFVQDTWRIHPKLTLEGGLFYERSNDGSTIPVFSSEMFRIHRLSPRVGLIWQPHPNHTLRMGYARYLQGPFIVPETLRPTDIGGFTLGQNAISSAFQEDISVGWHWKTTPWMFANTEGFRRTRTEKREDYFLGEFLSKDREFVGGRLELNFMFLNYFGFSPSYSFVRNLEEEFHHTYSSNPRRWRDDHELRLALRFVHPAGWRAGVTASYVNQRLNGFRMESPDDFWTLDMFLQKELFGKSFVLGSEVRNLLNEKFWMERELLSISRRLPARQFSFFVRYNF